MKNCKKHPNFIKGMCGLLVGTLAITSTICLWGDGMEVTAAKNALPGIEQLREEYVNNSKTYRILELVPDLQNAEIGYYVGGQEPFALLYDEESGVYRTWQEALLEKTDKAGREAFMTELLTEAKKINAYYEPTGKVPFTITEYEELGAYKEGASELKIDGEVVRGYLKYEAAEGEVKEWDATFLVLEDRNTSLEEINYSVTTPYYKAMNNESAFSYQELKEFAEAEATAGEDLYILRPEGHLEYMGKAGEVWEETESYLEELFESVSGGDAADGEEQVSGGDAQADIWSSSSGFYHPYFALVNKDNPAVVGDQVYLMKNAVYAEDGKGHYALVETVEREEPGEGFTYDATYIYFQGGLVNNEVFRQEVFALEAASCSTLRVEVETVTPSMLNALFEEKKVTGALEGAELLATYDMLYINGGAAMNAALGSTGSFGAESDINTMVLGALGMYITMGKVPCIFDLQPFVTVNEYGQYAVKSYETTAGQISLKDTNLAKLAYFLTSPSYDASGEDLSAAIYYNTNLDSLVWGTLPGLDKNEASNESIFGSDELENATNEKADKMDISFVKDNVWFVCNDPEVTGKDSLRNRGLFSAQEYALEQIKAGFAEVWREIMVENMYLAEQKEELLDTKIYDASVFRYIVNFRSQRQVSKNSLEVLVIEPAGRVPSVTAEEISKYTGVAMEDITLHVMAMNEFVGHIEDLSATYDIIYFDSNASNLPTVDGETVYNDSSMNGLLYSHVGDKLEAYAILSGLLDTDYTNNVRYSTLKETTLHRYSGNDLSVEKYNALKDYLDANYPIVISSGLLTKDGGQVDEKRVDNSSYLYEFLSEILADKSRKNIFVSDKLEENRSAFAFYANRPKLSLFSPEYGDLIMTKSVYRLADGTSNARVTEISPVNGRFYLQFDFVIENDSAADFGDDYTCKLYLDANADGKFSKAYEELSLNGNNVIDVSTGQSVGSTTKLKTGVRYQVFREVPDSFHGCITWQLEVSQTNCPGIHIQHKGYTKLATGEAAHIKILQIHYHDEGRYINLEQSIGHFENGAYNNDGMTYITNYFKNVAQNVSGDYILDIKTISKGVFETGYYDGEGGVEPIILNDYDMLILGFSDGKDEIDWTEGVDTDLPCTDATGNTIQNNSIRHFIESGRSVLFAHDMTSYTNVPNTSVLIGSSLGESYRIAANENRVLKNYYYETEKYGSWVWGYNINTKLRNLVGMDTFGISAGANKELLSGGKGLDLDGTSSSLVIPTKNASTGRYGYGVPDVAYAPGMARKSTVPQVQGFTAYILNRQVYDDGNVNFYRSGLGVNRSNNYSYQAEKVNDGQITNYPYAISEMPTLAETHQQYYTLDLNADNDNDGETDIVVWYNLAGGAYDNAPGDVKNNYYIYSKGNVIYTGMGHAATKKSDSVDPFRDAVTLEEAKLFINTMIAAYNAGQRSPQIVTMNAGGSPTDVVYNYYDTLIAESDQRVEIYFRVDDLNITQGIKEVELHYYREVLSESGEMVWEEVTEELLPYTYVGNEENSATPTESGYLLPETVYRVLVPLEYFSVNGNGYRSSLRIGGRTVMTHSSIVDGSKVASYTPYVYAQVQCVNVELFDLD